MNERDEIFYGQEKGSTGLVRADAYINEITRHLDDPIAIAEASKLVAEALFQYPKDQDFCLTSNEVGVKLEGAGHLELAAQCFEWAFEQSDSLANFQDPSVVVYGGNLVRVLQSISQQSQLTEDSREFLKDRKGVVKGIGKFFENLKDYRIFRRAFKQLDQTGGIVWNGDVDQQDIVKLQETEVNAHALANLL